MVKRKFSRQYYLGKRWRRSRSVLHDAKVATPGYVWVALAVATVTVSLGIYSIYEASYGRYAMANVATPVFTQQSTVVGQVPQNADSSLPPIQTIEFPKELVQKEHITETRFIVKRTAKPSEQPRELTQQEITKMVGATTAINTDTSKQITEESERASGSNSPSAYQKNQ